MKRLRLYHSKAVISKHRQNLSMLPLVYKQQNTLVYANDYYALIL